MMPDPPPLSSSSTSAVRLTPVRKPEARSAGNQSNDPVKQQYHRGRDAEGGAIAQKRQSFRDRLIPLSSMASRAKRLSGRAGPGEEQEALLPNIDPGDEEYSLSSTQPSLPSTRTSDSSLSDNFRADIHSYDVDQQVAPDQFIQGYETTKWEIWSYYGYYVGDTGLTLAIFAPMAMQNLLSLAAGEDGVLPFMGRYVNATRCLLAAGQTADERSRDRTVNSIVLLASAISFAIQIVVFLILGSFADFGTWRPSILILQTSIGSAIGFAWLGVYSPEQWKTAITLYVIGLIAFQTSMAYFFAAFPALARNDPRLRKKAEELKAGIIELGEYDEADSMARNHISNTSLWIAGVGGIGVIAAMMGILNAVNATADSENNSWGLSLIIGFGSAVWLVLAIPWFVLEKRRPGQPIPPGMNIFTAGFWQVYRAGTQIRKLSQSFAYLLGEFIIIRCSVPACLTDITGFFILGEALGTSVGVVNILQNEVAAYDITQLSQFIMMQFVSATIGVWVCIQIQKRYALTTKTMLCSVIVCIVIMDLWGIIGIWSDKIGYHNIWEFWVFGFWYGCFVSPWYSFSQTMVGQSPIDVSSFADVVRSLKSRLEAKISSFFPCSTSSARLPLSSALLCPVPLSTHLPATIRPRHFIS